MTTTTKYRTQFVLLGFCLIALFLLDLFLGSVYIPPGEVFKVFFTYNDSVFHKIILDFRLPKAVTAVLTGMSLSLCGMLMQTLFRNPLAGPYILGISSGASLGVAIAMMGATFIGVEMNASYGKLGIVAAAFMGSLLSIVFVLGVAKKVQNNISLLLIGIMIAYITGALETLLQYMANAESIKGFVLWGFGSLSNVDRNDLKIYFPIIIACCFFSYTLIKPLNALLLGENYAQSMGINIKKTRLNIILVSGGLVGITTAFCGPIAFVGIAIPHLCRMFFNSSNHRILITANLLVGAVVLLFCDIISQLPGSGLILPLNVVTSLIGAPIIIALLLKQKQLN